jgi:hypothetical protein
MPLKVVDAKRVDDSRRRSTLAARPQLPTGETSLIDESRLLGEQMGWKFLEPKEYLSLNVAMNAGGLHLGCDRQ